MRIRKQLRDDGWDYDPGSIHYEAALAEDFPGGQVSSVATIARHLAAVGQVDPSPRKRPRSSYIPFARATCDGPVAARCLRVHAPGSWVTIYQVLDDASRFDVGTQAHSAHQNSVDAFTVLKNAINHYGAPKELLSDNSSAFNQLRQGRIGTVEVFLAGQGHQCESPGAPDVPPPRARTSALIRP